jgi:hypothetical protein
MTRDSLPTFSSSCQSGFCALPSARHWLNGGVACLIAALLLLVLVVPTQAQQKMSKKEKNMLMQLQKMNQADGYLEAHRKVKEPLELLGDPFPSP